jgi:ComF family protein
MGLLLPSSCVLCDCSVSRAISLCKSCEEGLPILINACKQCGLPLDTANENNAVCGHCLDASTSVDYTMCLYHYQSPLDYLITTLKYKQQLSHAAILGYLLLDKLKQQPIKDLPDCIIPVPLHKNRLVKRGFNQSLEIARPVSQYFNIPIDLKCIIRKKQTSAQADLNATQRKKNVKGCFELSSKASSRTPVNYRHVVIIDDVVTTGSTINEMAKQLKRSGVERVDVWSIARAVLSS